MTEYISKVQLIKTATVPIIKAVCTERYYEKNIDITYKNYDLNGLQAMQLMRQYLSKLPLTQKPIRSSNRLSSS